MLSAGAIEHLNDLRRRLVLGIGAMVASGVGIYLFKADVMALLLRPLENLEDKYIHVVYNGVADLFFIYLKMSAWGGVFMALPLLMWLLWRFVAPGLYAGEKKLVGPLLAAIPVLFYTGGLFAYFVVVPTALEFFLGFNQVGVVAQPDLRSYLSFVFTMAFAFGVAFNLPVFLLLLIKAKLLTVETLARYRRLAILAILVVAAVLTPPDPFSQLAMALPLYLLYEAAIVAAKWLKL